MSALWDAVDAITKPSMRQVTRDDAPEWLVELAEDATLTRCDVRSYRAATTNWGTQPSLWMQAEQALTTGTEAGGTGKSPLRERSPADLDLMETMLTIRESMSWQLTGRGITPKPGMQAQMRQLAAHVVTNEPQHVQWWTYRFEQWERVLAVYLRAIDTGPRPVRLRNSSCPKCHVAQVTVETDSGPIVAPALVIDFVNGWIRAAECTACGASWFRGDDLGQLAEQLDTKTA